AHQPRRRHGLEGRDVPGCGEYDVRVAAVVVAGPRPYRGAARTVRSRRLDVEPLELRLLVDDDQVHVVAAAETVVGDGEEAIGIGRQVDARDGSLLREHRVDQARPLMAEAVVVVPPARRGQEG